MGHRWYWKPSQVIPTQQIQEVTPKAISAEQLHRQALGITSESVDIYIQNLVANGTRSLVDSLLHQYTGTAAESSSGILSMAGIYSTMTRQFKPCSISTNQAQLTAGHTFSVGTDGYTARI